MPTARFVRHITSVSTNSIGTDALNSLGRIPGVSNLELVEESDDHAVINYAWNEQVAPPDDPGAHFRAFGLEKLAGAA